MAQALNDPDNDTIYVERTPPDYRKQQARPDVAGWGADLDHANRPAYPMERTPPRLENIPEPEHQHNPKGVRVFHSTERPGLTPVYGTAAPPQGLSGMLRSWAFRHSENDLRHWYILMLADRVNVVEGLVEDLAHGHVPNLWKETGLGAEWRHNKKGLITKALVAGAVAGVMLHLMRRDKD